jgi:flagellar hook assembly protein FlgD
LNASGAPASPGSRLGAVGLLALLVASVALGIYVYRARTPDLALEVTKFPNEFGSRNSVDIEFFVRLDSDDATIEIVGRDQELTRTLASGMTLEAEEPVTCVWDGADDAGGLVEPGRYRLRVTLPEEDREMVFPERLDVKAVDRIGDQTGGYDLNFGEPCTQEASG